MSHQGIRQVLTYLPIFFIGLFFRKAIFRLANHAFSLPTILITAGLFIASEVINYALDHSVFAEWDDTCLLYTSPSPRDS